MLAAPAARRRLALKPHDHPASTVGGLALRLPCGPLTTE